jgi:hypothetical protein
MAEFGFFGLVVKTRVQTPRFNGQSCSAGDLLFSLMRLLPKRTNWLIVGKFPPVKYGPSGKFWKSVLFSGQIQNLLNQARSSSAGLGFFNGFPNFQAAGRFYTRKQGKSQAGKGFLG